MRRLAVFTAAVFLLAGTAPAYAEPGARSRVSYRPPVDAPIVDHFRPPSDAYSAGNRGIDYATTPGTSVLSSGDGEVVFAGPVGGSLHVVVLHPDGIRTSYSFLESISVRRGDVIGQGEPVGTAAERLHFGARAGDAYLDPTLLFSGDEPSVYLVPDEARGPETVANERKGLLDSLEGMAERVIGLPPGAYSWVREGAVSLTGEAVEAARIQATEAFDELHGIAHYAWEMQPGVHLARIGNAGWSWWEQRYDCTPEGLPPPRHSERHLAVLVGGLGSSSGNAAIDDVDTGNLGYAPDDVKRFSYKGGTTDEQPYEPADTTVDIRESSRRLRYLLAELAERHPGVPIDVIAHSQGGLVSRAALGDEIDPGSAELPKINSLVTVASPHQGADIATAGNMLGKSEAGRSIIDGVSLTGAPVKGNSVRQMAETSEFLRRLNQRPLPSGLKVTSIGGRGDIVVPAGRTRLDGARHVVIAPPGLLDQHSQIPGSDAATREIALGQAGMAPTCQSLTDMVTDTFISDAIGATQDNLGATAWAATRAADIPLVHERKNP